jgi:hypothetical protein
MTSSEFEPSTFQLVAQCLDQLCYRVPHQHKKLLLKHTPGLITFDIYNGFAVELMNQTEIRVVRNYFQYHYNYYKGTEDPAMGPLYPPYWLKHTDIIHVQKLLDSQLVKKFPTCFGTRKFHSRNSHWTVYYL